MVVLRAILIFFACCFLTGCGLLAVPYRVTLPREPLQHVRVVDQKTGQPLPEADVLCQTYKYVNWFTRADWNCVAPDDQTQIYVIDDYDQKVRSLETKALGDGEFTIESTWKIGWLQIWFPLPLPTGWFEYRSHDCLLIASAPGHDTVWISNPYAWRQPQWHGRTHGLDFDDFIYIKKNHVTIKLPKRINPNSIPTPEESP